MPTLRSSTHKKWHKELVKKLEHIHWCEKCGRTDMQLDPAHRVKRVFIGCKTEADHQEYLFAAKLCRYGCHRGLDEATGDDPHTEMYNEITEIVNNRKEDIHIA